ncbi:MAG: hypothetical protein K2Q24_14810 [Chitinophagaceae bacterium]|nr:hypothetical protein [Chitinophagaceae bacterium]
MNKTRFLTIAVLLLLILNASTLFFLFQKRGGPHSYRGGRPYSEFMSKQLKLDAQQETQLKQLRDEHKTELDKLRKEDMELHEQLFMFVKTGNNDSLWIDSITTLIAANKKRFEHTFFKHFLQIRSICRPDQLELFNTTIDQIMKRRMPSPGEDRNKKHGTSQSN